MQPQDYKEIYFVWAFMSCKKMRFTRYIRKGAASSRLRSCAGAGMAAARALLLLARALFSPGFHLLAAIKAVSAQAASDALAAADALGAVAVLSDRKLRLAAGAKPFFFVPFL
jgi:hypothetical protein